MADSNVTQIWEANARLARAARAPAAAPSKQAAETIEEVRTELFGAMAMIGVARNSIDFDNEHDLHRLLEDAYKRFDAIGWRLNEISSTVARLMVTTASVAALPSPQTGVTHV